MKYQTTHGLMCKKNAGMGARWIGKGGSVVKR